MPEALPAGASAALEQEVPEQATGRRGPAWWPTWRAAVFDVLIALCSIPLVLWDVLDVSRGMHPVPRTGLLLLGVAACGLLLVRRDRPVLTTAGALVALLLGSDWLGLLAAYALGRYRRADRVTVTLVTAVFALTLATSLTGLPEDLHAPGSDWWLDAAVTVTVIALPALFGAHLRTRHQLVQGLRERAAHLERERHLLAVQALALERARIAREMHDVVAHQIGLVVVYSNVLQTAADDDPAQMREIAQRMGDGGRKALAELREVITVLRGPGPEPAPSPAPGPTALRALVQESRNVGLPVTLLVTGAEQPLPEPVAQTVFRLVQEALSNVRKHARGAATEVLLAYTAASVTAVVRNVAPGSGSSAFEALPGSGHGLIGMQERVTACRGSFRAGPLDGGGFEVRAELPVTGGA